MSAWLIGFLFEFDEMSRWKPFLEEKLDVEDRHSLMWYQTKLQ